MRTIDDEKEKSKEMQKEKKKIKSFANGIKSFCIYVPRSLITKIIKFPTPFLLLTNCPEGLNF